MVKIEVELTPEDYNRIRDAITERLARETESPSPPSPTRLQPSSGPEQITQGEGDPAEAAGNQLALIRE